MYALILLISYLVVHLRYTYYDGKLQYDRIPYLMDHK